MEGLVVVFGVLIALVSAIVFTFQKYPMPEPTSSKAEYVIQRYAVSRWVRMGAYKSFDVALIHAEDQKFMNPDYKYRILTIVDGKRIKTTWV